MKYILILLCTFGVHTLYAQTTFKGKVLNTTNDPIKNATITVNDSVVATTNNFGLFEATLNQPSVAYIFAEGYEVFETELNDANHFYKIIVKAEADLDELVVNVNKKNTQRGSGATNTQTMNGGELLKAACCNLAESFETNPSIDVNFSDAISGSKQIKMLGLTSPYILIAEENIPSVRGASQAYGLSFTPGTWVESIQVTKGAGSVVNGFESISGQINTELIKPANDIPFYLNLYGSTDARFEINAHFNEKISDKWSSSLFVHGNTRVKKNDMNHDGFLDNPLGSQINVMNRWQYLNLEKGWVAFLTARYMKDEKQTGEIDFDSKKHKLSTLKWGSELNTDKFDASSKIGYVFPDQPYKSFGWQNSFSYHKQNSYFGLNQFDITQRSIYSNLLYSSIISNTLHKFSVGASFMYDDYSEFVSNYGDQNYDRTDTSYGAFFEYTYDNADNLALILGGRIDNSNRLGVFVTPRMHLKYNPWEKTTLRASAGRGKRLANVFAENQYLFASARKFNINNQGGKAYGMDPEIAWNYGLSISQDFTFLGKNASLTLDFYRTDFQNQIVVDLDQSARTVNFYNLDGKSYANSFQAELNYNIIKHLNLRTAYKYYDIQTTYGDKTLERPLQAKHRLFANLEYSTHEHNGAYWKFDATWNWLGAQRLPYTGDNSTENQLTSYTNPFSTINAQITKVFSDKFEVYVGGENIGNYQQHRVILGADEPFGNEFDSTIIYGPVFGQMYYAGLRFKIK